jgi:CHASE3 domain sensor protein
LLGDRQKVLLIGSDFGYGNFGDVLQHVNSVQFGEQSGRFVTVSVLAANAIGFRDFPGWCREAYGTDALLFVSEFPLILDEGCPALLPMHEIRNLAVIHLYGGGFLNQRWGDFVLGVTELLLTRAPHATYLVSGQQITDPFQSRVAAHIQTYKPRLFGVRDELSRALLRHGVFEPQFSFDDATEALLKLAQGLPLEKGSGLLMHLSSSDYSARAGNAWSLAEELQLLRGFAGAHPNLTLFQAFVDARYQVRDSIETVKELDLRFPFADFRLVRLGELALVGRAGNVVGPVLGDIGYSCSYHVALFLQLGGIPCWLRSDNSYYEQKSKALQVTQSLRAFLDEPRVADHSSNLERRAEWREAFDEALADVGEVLQTTSIKASDADPAPWPFCYKGQPNVDEIINRAQEKLEGAEALEDRLRRLERDNLELLAQRDAFAALVSEVGDDVHTQQARADGAESQLHELRERLQQLNEQLEKVSGSRLWKAMRPLRALGRFVQHGHFDSAGQIGMYEAARRIGRRVPMSAGLRAKVGRFLAKFRRT